MTKNVPKLVIVVAVVGLLANTSYAAWPKVRLVSPKEAATIHGTCETGDCEGEDQRDDCEGPLYYEDCTGRVGEARCQSNVWTAYNWHQISWCTGWPDGPKTCYYMGQEDCADEVKCWWIEGQGCYLKNETPNPRTRKASHDDCP